MKSYIQIDELKSIQLEILDIVSEFCESNNLTYFLAYGTLIGAIRHKGYIPWDDDIDIIMPRPDYEVFLREFNSVDGHAKVIDTSLDKQYTLPFAKVYDLRTEMHETMYKQSNFGVYIDVFPLDGYRDKSVIKKLQWYSKIINTKHAILGDKRSLLKNLIIGIGKVLLLPFSSSYILNKYKEVAAKEEYETCDMVNSMFSPYVEKEYCKKTLLSETIDWEFEGRNYKIPKNYDIYLRNIYGDYMKLPPIEKQITHHVFKAWWKDNDEK